MKRKLKYAIYKSLIDINTIYLHNTKQKLEITIIKNVSVNKIMYESKKFRIKVITSNKTNKNIIKATLKITPNILQVYSIKPQTLVVEQTCSMP